MFHVETLVQTLGGLAAEGEVRIGGVIGRGVWAAGQVWVGSGGGSGKRGLEAAEEAEWAGSGVSRSGLGSGGKAVPAGFGFGSPAWL